MAKKVTHNEYLKLSFNEFLEASKMSSDYRVVESKKLKRLFDGALYLTTTATIMIFFSGYYASLPIDILNVSGGFAIVFSFLLSFELFQRFPKTIFILWRRNLLCPSNQNSSSGESLTSVNTYIIQFLHETRQIFNNRIGILFGFLGISIVAWIVWLLDQGWIVNIPYYIQTVPLPFSIVFFPRVVFLYSGFVGGMIGWRVFIIGRRLSALGTSFDVNLQVNHPDGCAGLSPIGDLSLRLVYCIVPFLILIGAWLTLVNTIDLKYLYMLPANIKRLSSTLQLLIIPLAAFSSLCFFFPLTSIHNSMLRAKSILEAQLDLLAQEIHYIDSQLLTEASSLPSKRRSALEEKSEFLKRSYSRFHSIPTWPFRSSHLLRLTSTQIIPIIGIISSIVEFVRNIMK